ncbi:MAG: metal ABC transporter substrate-binding protein [Phycisphaerales bacterium]
MRRAVIAGLILLLVIVAGVIALRARPAPLASPRVVVTIAPLRGLVEPMLPQGEPVGVVIPPGLTVHGYEPTPADRAMLERADLVVCVGLGLEGSLDPVLNELDKRGKLVRFAEVVGIAPGVGAEHVHEDDEPDADEEHHHHGVDPHLWLDPKLCEQLVDAVHERLDARAVGTEERARLTMAWEGMRARIAEVRALYAAALAPYAGVSLVTHHAAWGRLLDPFGITVAAVIRPIEGAEPTPGELAAARQAIEQAGAVGVIIEPQFDASWPRRIAQEAGVPLGVLDPLGDGDWFKMMRTNLDELVRVLSAARAHAAAPAPEDTQP